MRLQTGLLQKIADRIAQLERMQREINPRIREGMRASYFTEQRNMDHTWPAADWDRQWAQVEPGDWQARFHEWQTLISRTKATRCSGFPRLAPDSPD